MEFNIQMDFDISFCLLKGGVEVKPQWKAAIDFKWIRDNKKAVSNNIRLRNSNANLELVLELYEKMLNVQKVRFLCYQISPL